MSPLGHIYHKFSDSYQDCRHLQETPRDFGTSDEGYCLHIYQDTFQLVNWYDDRI